MTTSGIISGEITARVVMQNAAEDLGVLGAGEELSAEEFTSMLSRLNWLLKSWQSQGANLWRTETGEITIPQGSVSGSLDPRVIDVIAARVITGNAPNVIELQMQRIEQGEYAQLPNKTQPGRPTMFFLSKQRNQVDLYVWPVPYQDMDFKIDYARVIEDVTDPNQTLDVPQQWAETVWTNLAVKCATLFGATRLDPNAVALVTQRAAVLKQQLMDMDRPASWFLGNIYSRNF